MQETTKLTSQYRGWTVELSLDDTRAPFSYEWSIQLGSELHPSPTGYPSAEAAIREACRAIDYFVDQAPNQLYAVSGRKHGDGDDTVIFVWARSDAQAKAYFKEDLLDGAVEDPLHLILIVSCQFVGSMSAGRFALDESLLPPGGRQARPVQSEAEQHDAEAEGARREAVADREFEAYDFSELGSVVAHGHWDAQDPNDWVKRAYVQYSDEPAEADSHLVSFHVRFTDAGAVEEVYALECDKGQQVGQRGGVAALVITA